MTRLQRELQRLYWPTTPMGANPLVDAHGQVRAVVLALSAPADWAALSRVWQGVQTDLGLPPPAIAVSGQDAYQLWFSLSAALPAPQAQAWGQALCARYLSEIPPHRLAVLPAVDATAEASVVRHALQVPAPQAAGGRWSAFVAPDLAPMFAEEPWLDLPPSPEGQADLLSRLASMPAADVARALAMLQPAATVAAPLSAAASATAAASLATNPHPTLTGGPWTEPQGFLLAVMNNDSVPLGLRIEAAKALLPCCDRIGRP